VAVVQEWLDADAGSEKVFAHIAACLPEADLLALSQTPGHGVDLGGRPVRTTVLDHPALRDRRGLTLPLMPSAWRALGSSTYDWSVTSHHAFALCNRLAPAAHSLVYVHSPARYLWYPELDGRGGGRARAIARAVLRGVDRRAAQRPASLAANSTEVRRRIRECWGRDARVIPPPVDTTFFAAASPVQGAVARVPQAHSDGAVLFVGRWVGYKRPDLAVRLGEALDRPVVIAGSGPLEPQLRRLAARARVPVHLCVRPDAVELRELYRRAAFVVFLGHEDFGIVPVEAMATGTPVLALGVGGALDTVREGSSGHVVPSLDLAVLVAGAHRVEGVTAQGCREVAATFGAEVFRSRLRGWFAETGLPAPRPAPALPQPRRPGVLGDALAAGGPRPAGRVTTS
jgi:glycosyltransferase involved in cell wall biosynthesis